MNTFTSTAALALSLGLLPPAEAATPAAAAPSALALLTQARAAAGDFQKVPALQARGRIKVSGLEGSWSLLEDVQHGRWTLQVDVGVQQYAEGVDGPARWRQDPSGGVHWLNSDFAKTASITEAWLAQRGWLRPAAAGAELGPVREAAEGEQRYFVLPAQPKKGQQVEMWFDAKTHLLSQTVRLMPISTLTVRYGDYRAVNGVQLPHRIESADSGSSDKEVVAITQWAPAPAPKAQAFAAPQPPDDTTLTGETTIPMEVDGFVVVQAKLNGKPFDFILDTGGHNIITPQAAAALGIKGQGQGASGGAGEGETAQQYARIDTLEMGAAVMRNQHFYVMPFDYATLERGRRAPLGGLLGLEIFERFAVRMDYPGKQLTLRRLAGFKYKGTGVAVPIMFSDDMPLLMGRINGIDALIALDTGNGGSTVIQHVWARKHGLAERLKAGVETVSFGAGGASRNWASRVDSMEVGGVSLPRPLLRYAEDKAGAFSSRTEAANIGTEVAANFILDIDYGNNVIWFEHKPGYQQPAFNRLGLRAIKMEPGSLKVRVVSEGSPAAAAGITTEDEIIAVDGVPAVEFSGRDFGRKLIQPVGTEVTLTLRRRDTERQLKLKLADVLP